MAPAPDIHAIARDLKAAQDGVRQIEPLTSLLLGLDVPAAAGVMVQGLLRKDALIEISAIAVLRDPLTAK